ncbi:TonB-dependent receptor [Alkalisalibacterium limincola]|uniref:TonB-dependent receptor n=1 Tax=Alkalisalibacterium limincola TaxID=2699169 RepID=UPI00164FF6FF|nr:TonB-dependent receptor [Alkalisalibacterium limincola]
MRWSHGSLTSRLWANYVHGYFDDDQRAEVPEGRRIPSWTLVNFNIDWDVSARQTLGLTIRNLADRDPPVALGSAANVDLFNHNTLGRFYTLNWVYRY